MALLDPHPALKVAVPENPMVDGWMGDDWFHYGAFRQPNFDYTFRPDGPAGRWRFHSARRLTYQSPVLTEPVRLGGAPVADLFASTTGTDADWVVKLIDVFPDEVPNQPEMGGYELSISMDISAAATPD